MGTPLSDRGVFMNHKFTYLDDRNKKKVIKFNEILNKLDIPILYLVGTNDFIVHVKTVKKLLANFNPNIQVEILEGLNHYLIKGEDNWFKDRSSDVLKKLYLINEQPLQIILDWVVKV